ncbi:hypothetical protein [Paraburkholderia humisilvae]|uniref:Uncharacterized protein n=1 Tax=Paraburkholderia humisilvae TaxID=627669 RepID=A0A6J5DKJ3_9BURK|nr:hypothetical protein [Paraburkholderia humisilvae]CAB3754608.1 hypothetical protein LMG29542_02397 [Paraburkholderia humisilvae]
MVMSKLSNITKAFREQCFGTPAQGMRTLCCLVSMFILGIALGTIEGSPVVVTFCMLLVMAIVQGMSSEDSPLLGPVAAVAFGIGGAIGLTIVACATQLPANRIGWVAAAGGGAVGAIWWLMLMSRWIWGVSTHNNGGKRGPD